MTQALGGMFSLVKLLLVNVEHKGNKFSRTTSACVFFLSSKLLSCTSFFILHFGFQTLGEIVICQSSRTEQIREWPIEEKVSIKRAGKPVI